jgi:hypothetical protein
MDKLLLAIGGNPKFPPGDRHRLGYLALSTRQFKEHKLVPYRAQGMQALAAATAAGAAPTTAAACTAQLPPETIVIDHLPEQPSAMDVTAEAYWDRAGRSPEFLEAAKTWVRALAAVGGQGMDALLAPEREGDGMSPLYNFLHQRELLDNGTWGTLTPANFRAWASSDPTKRPELPSPALSAALDVWTADTLGVAPPAAVATAKPSTGGPHVCMSSGCGKKLDGRRKCKYCDEHCSVEKCSTHKKKRVRQQPLLQPMQPAGPLARNAQHPTMQAIQAMRTQQAIQEQQVMLSQQQQEGGLLRTADLLAMCAQQGADVQAIHQLQQMQPQQMQMQQQQQFLFGQLPLQQFPFDQQQGGDVQAMHQLQQMQPQQMQMLQQQQFPFGQLPLQQFPFGQQQGGDVQAMHQLQMQPQQQQMQQLPFGQLPLQQQQAPNYGAPLGQAPAGLVDSAVAAALQAVAANRRS